MKRFFQINVFSNHCKSKLQLSGLLLKTSLNVVPLFHILLHVKKDYVLFQSIGLKMGLNTKNPSTLWKDKALLEMNIAIIHSFQVNVINVLLSGGVKHVALENENCFVGKK